MLELKAFGGLRLEVDGAPYGGIAARPKTLGLLALLAPGPNGMSRDKLVAYLWPESDTARGRHLLKQACHDLRRELSHPELFGGRKVLQLNPAAIACDVRRFETALEQGELGRAVAEYAGPFLDGYYLDGCEEFERWVDTERERLARRAGTALKELATDAGGRGDHRTAADWWRRLTELDPLSAEATLGRMNALATARERAEALRVGREYTELVQRELGAAPARAITKLIEQLRHQSEEPVQQPAVAPPRPPATLQVRETAGPPTAGASQHPLSRKRPVILAAGALVAAAAVVGIMIGSAPARRVIAVSPIRDYSGFDSAARLGRAVTEMLAAGLARAPGVQVISTTRLNEIAGSTAVAGDSRVTIAHAASRAGATDLLEGTLLRHPAGTLRLELQVVDLKTGLVRRAYVAEDKDPIALAGRLIGQVAEAFAMPPPK